MLGSSRLEELCVTVSAWVACSRGRPACTDERCGSRQCCRDPQGCAATKIKGCLSACQPQHPPSKSMTGLLAANMPCLPDNMCLPQACSTAVAGAGCRGRTLLQTRPCTLCMPGTPPAASPAASPSSSMPTEPTEALPPPEALSSPPPEGMAEPPPPPPAEAESPPSSAGGLRNPCCRRTERHLRSRRLSAGVVVCSL